VGEGGKSYDGESLVLCILYKSLVGIKEISEDKNTRIRRH
jgi:hypothetical protein